MSEFEGCRWFLTSNGIADAWLCDFDADGWRLRHGNPAAGALAILPGDDGKVATLDDALWLADAVAFDHDAPIGVHPAARGIGPDARPVDPMAVPPAQPVQPFEDGLVFWYWEALAQAYESAALLRFNASFVLRYASDGDGPSTDFTRRFKGREEALSMYAMATRQADLLSEYLLLYRILEEADGSNGTSFATAQLPELLDHGYGELLVARDVIGQDEPDFTDVFRMYKTRARSTLDSYAANAIDDIPDYLYRIRNSLAHGKADVIARTHGSRFHSVAGALPVLKLLARLAVAPI